MIPRNWIYYLCCFIVSAALLGSVTRIFVAWNSKPPQQIPFVSSEWRDRSWRAQVYPTIRQRMLIDLVSIQLPNSDYHRVLSILGEPDTDREKTMARDRTIEYSIGPEEPVAHAFGSKVDIQALTVFFDECGVYKGWHVSGSVAWRSSVDATVKSRWITR